MIEGSCLCGGVRYEYDGAFGSVTVCHCATCRKAQGTSSAVDTVPVAHIFATGVPPWAALDDDWPRYTGLEPERG